VSGAAGTEGTGVTVRAATAGDAGVLAALAERTFRDAFGGSNAPADMDAHCARAYSEAQQAGEIADPSMDTLVAETGDGTLVGFAMVREGPAPEVVRGPLPIELWRIYVDRAHHGHGVAQALMEASLDAARRRGGATIWLGVWERNPRAQAFYRKMGFDVVGTHTFLLGSDPQTDHVMAQGLLSRAAGGAGRAGRSR
jgi:ribosomal protein S18 acetylase RimI-like enzyme